MKPYAELNVMPLSSLFFGLPEADCGRCDVSIAIEYCKSDENPNEAHCWAWAQVGDAFIRGLVDEYTVQYDNDKIILAKSVVYALNNSKRFRESLPGFIEAALMLDPAIER